jgi:hypothetical protein
MPSSRLAELLDGAAQDLLDARSPLSLEFLSSHQVTADECLGLTELIGHVLNGYALSPPLVQNNILLAGIMRGTDLADRITGEDLFSASLQTLPRSRSPRRMQSLLKHLAQDFLEARETFSHEFLVRHHVTSTECLNLSELSGHVLHGYLGAAKVVRNTVLICGIVGKAIPSELVFSAGLQIDVTEKLHALNVPFSSSPPTI